jgi:hypothetical protein
MKHQRTALHGVKEKGSHFWRWVNGEGASKSPENGVGVTGPEIHTWGSGLVYVVSISHTRGPQEKRICPLPPGPTPEFHRMDPKAGWSWMVPSAEYYLHPLRSPPNNLVRQARVIIST